MRVVLALLTLAAGGARGSATSAGAIPAGAVVLRAVTS